MTPHLTATCGCGRSLSIACPTLADIQDAQEQMPGWGYDERGLVRCPDCLAAGAVESRPVAREPDLFGGAAA